MSGPSPQTNSLRAAAPWGRRGSVPGTAAGSATRSRAPARPGADRRPIVQDDATAGLASTGGIVLAGQTADLPSPDGERSGDANALPRPGEPSATGGDWPAQIVDTITLRSAAEVAARRETLRELIFGSRELPQTEAVPQSPSVSCQVPGLSSVASTEELRIAMDEGERGLACHFSAAQPNGELVAFNPGHFHLVGDESSWESDGWTGYGNQRTVQTLLDAGYGVLVVFMPHYQPDDFPDYWGEDPHVIMFARLRPPTGSVWKYFIEPVTASLNYLARPAARGGPGYSAFHMLGLSGGGWTTVIAAAVDPRIKVSVHVAGSEPFDFWNEGSADEQTLPALYRVAAYRDLYIMGASGAGRRQLQVLNRYDTCCFFPGWGNQPAQAWELSVRGYESAIQGQLARIQDAGSFRAEIDDTAVTHQISRHALGQLILPLLGASRTSR